MSSSQKYDTQRLCVAHTYVESHVGHVGGTLEFADKHRRKHVWPFGVLCVRHVRFSASDPRDALCVGPGGEPSVATDPPAFGTRDWLIIGSVVIQLCWYGVSIVAVALYSHRRRRRTAVNDGRPLLLGTETGEAADANAPTVH